MEDELVSKINPMDIIYQVSADYTKSPFKFDKKLDSSYQIPKDVLDKLLKFRPVEELPFLNNTVIPNFNSYGISNNEMALLKSEFFIDESEALSDEEKSYYSDEEDKEYKEESPQRPPTPKEEEQSPRPESPPRPQSPQRPPVTLKEEEEDSDLEEDDPFETEKDTLPPLRDFKKELPKPSTTSDLKLISSNTIDLHHRNVKMRKLDELKELIRGSSTFINATFKREEVIKYFMNLVPQYRQEEFNDLSAQDIDQLYELIEDLKKRNNIDISYFVIKIVVLIVEKFCVYQGYKQFDGVSKKITSELIKKEMYNTHSFINSKVDCPNLPFIDIIYFLGNEWFFNVMK